MARFIQCAIPGRNYRGNRVENVAVNIDTCTSMRKSRIKWYPDNTGIPSIKFAGSNAEWAYESDAQRDSDYERIIELTNQERTP